MRNDSPTRSGLYSTPVDRLGMVSADAWRAVRLVTDTGIHLHGWTRQQAIDFFVEHAPLSVKTITGEIDRYIGMPGQALAYKMGPREIFRLRSHAQREMGPRFTYPAFHDVVLGHGGVPLSVLGQLVKDWVARA